MVTTNETNLIADDEALDVPGLPELDTQERLRALGQDRRADFLPTTHMEKNWALALLDYIDFLDPAAGLHVPRRGHASRTAGQLNEVFVHHKVIQRKKHPEDLQAAEQAGVFEGQRALRSITLTFGDFLANAITQKEKLEQLEHDINDCPNPAVTLAEELGADHQGLPPFIRFFDLHEFRRIGFSATPGFDPLSTLAVREGVEEADRNKYIEDQYTAGKPKPIVTEHISHAANSLTIGSVRRSIIKGNVNLARGAVLDQENRIDFWTTRLREVRNHMAARPIASRILENLGIALR